MNLVIEKLDGNTLRKDVPEVPPRRDDSRARAVEGSGRG